MYYTWYILSFNNGGLRAAQFTLSNRLRALASLLFQLVVTVIQPVYRLTLRITLGNNCNKMLWIKESFQFSMFMMVRISLVIE